MIGKNIWKVFFDVHINTDLLSFQLFANKFEHVRERHFNVYRCFSLVGLPCKGAKVSDYLSIRSTCSIMAKAAMKEKDITRKNAIQMVRSAVLQVEKDNKVTLDDDGILEVIAKEVKKRKTHLQSTKNLADRIL